MHTTEDIKATRLPSGVLVLTEAMPGVASLALGVWVDAGSADESTPAQHGQAHFLEHMLFKGTETRDAFTLAEEIEDVGGQINAFTDRETTHLYARVLAEHGSTVLALLADMVCRSTFPADEFERERQVIIEEIRKYEAMPDERIHDLIMEALWTDGGLGHAILGSEASVGGFTTDDIRACWRRHFAADRAIITAAGRLEHDRIVDEVARLFEAMPPALGTPAGTPLGTPTPLRVVEEDEEQVNFTWGGTTFPADDPRNFPLAMLDGILGASATSRLFQEIREKQGLAYDIASYTMGFRHTGMVCASGASGPETFPQVLELTRREIDRLARDGVTERELKRAREQIKSGLALSLESTVERMRRLATHQLTWGRVLPLPELISCLDAVTADDVSAVIAETIRLPAWSFTAIGPVTEAEVIPFVSA
jgi:predicted Zn-dependent peptidase